MKNKEEAPKYPYPTTYRPRLYMDDYAVLEFKDLCKALGRTQEEVLAEMILELNSLNHDWLDATRKFSPDTQQAFYRYNTWRGQIRKIASSIGDAKKPKPDEEQTTGIDLSTIEY